MAIAIVTELEGCPGPLQRLCYCYQESARETMQRKKSQQGCPEVLNLQREGDRHQGPPSPHPPVPPMECMLTCPPALQLSEMWLGLACCAMPTMRGQSWELVEAAEFQRLLCGHLCYFIPGFQSVSFPGEKLW